ncbi:serine/threonine-protein kinase [Aeromicrobium stalagmiti]|uniref:serine/threonine-protein kinase n=1 Tax=Aeromicrobium stalagmiti TaxID=2738988 RepID=UPI00156966BE|nr:serine/threonine-protein kinase [Aeromicrobium stalagmiti]NRQ49416.1 serine/threonine protein kinase [Aeromicrobium stalagmiti]
MTQIARYRLDEVHGFGAFATVWRGWDTELEITVAVKVLAENWANHADVRERFLAEARLLRRIDDPRVIRVHDVGTHEGRPYFVMDFIHGGTLAERVHPRLPTDAALRLASQAARAVQVLHDAGVLHRDIKPSNVLVRTDDDGADHALISDLGSAKQLAEASGITVTTGTPAYMSPEQARGRPVDARADVYSLGALTYELLAGTPPFEGGNLTELLSRTPTTRPDPVARSRSLPRSIDRVLGRALAFQPADRPATAVELADALDQVVDGTKLRGFRRLRRDVPVAVVLALAVVAFAGAAAAVLWWP